MQPFHSYIQQSRDRLDNWDPCGSGGNTFQQRDVYEDEYEKILSPKEMASFLLGKGSFTASVLTLLWRLYRCC